MYVNILKIISMLKLIKLFVALVILPSVFFIQTASALFGDAGSSNSESCFSLQNNLSYRSRDTQENEDVTKLQTFLYDNGYLKVKPTGFFGVNTRNAVKNFQIARLNDVQANNIDSSIIALESDRLELSDAGFVLSNTGYVGMYTRAKLAYFTCLAGGNLSDNDGNGNNNGNNNWSNGENGSGDLLSGPTSCTVPTYDSSSISNSTAAANGTCELTLKWELIQAPLSSKVIKWQLAGSSLWSGNITLSDSSLSSKSKTFILGPSNMTVVVSSNGQDIFTKVIGGVCASGAVRDTTNGRCVISNSPTTTQLAITTTSLPNATIGASYTYGITSTGGTGARDWIITGNLPAGMYLNRLNCINSPCSQPMTIGFTGNPTTSGSYTFIATAVVGGQSVSKQLTIIVGSASIVPTYPDNVASTHTLPPTGITFYGDKDNINANASVASDSGEYPRQDARYAKSFDYTKIANDGSTLPASAALGTGPKDWACTKDNITGMIWEVKTTSGLRSVDNTYLWPASEFPSAVNNLRLCGLSNWRVPTIKELESIVDYGKSSTTIGVAKVVIDTTFFPNTALGQYWSSTRLAGVNDTAWYVDFSYGTSQIYTTLVDNNSNWRVRLVSGSTAPTNNFVNNGNGTITDNNTSLMWKRDYEMLTTGLPVSWDDCISVVKQCDRFSWQDALKRATSDRTGGYSDWRVPNIKELRSLVDESRISPAINLGFFPATIFQGHFWSSSPTSDINGYMNLAWSLASDYGQIDPKTSRVSKHYVRLVRDITR